MDKVEGGVKALLWEGTRLRKDDIPAGWIHDLTAVKGSSLPSPRAGVISSTSKNLLQGRCVASHYVLLCANPKCDDVSFIFHMIHAAWKNFHGCCLGTA